MKIYGERVKGKAGGRCVAPIVLSGSLKPAWDCQEITRNYDTTVDCDQFGLDVELRAGLAIAARQWTFSLFSAAEHVPHGSDVQS